MAKRAARAGSWFDTRRLVLLETVLLLGLLGEMAEEAVLAWELVHPLVRVLLAIAIVVGAFGGVVLVFERYVRHGIERTHAVVRRFRVPLVAVHLVAVAALFLGYAWWWDAKTGAVRALRGLVGID